MKKTETTEARIGVFVRLVGLIFLAVGLGLGYSAWTTPLTPTVLPVFYLASGLFFLSGVLALIVKLE